MKPLVFLHGWAQSRQIWFQQFKAFPDAQFLNLPGHGGAADAPPEQWTECIAEQLPDENCVLVGWSLGGMLAMNIAATFPERIAGLGLISTTPCFRQKADWSPGCEESLFAAFEQAVQSGSARLLNRFFALMLHGDDLDRRAYNVLAKAAVDRQHPATASGLAGGLELLAALDLRAKAEQIVAPSLLLHGMQDAIVSAASGQWLARVISGSQIEQFERCGHAPFLTRPDSFNSHLHNWWQTL